MSLLTVNQESPLRRLMPRVAGLLMIVTLAIACASRTYGTETKAIVQTSPMDINCTGALTEGTVTIKSVELNNVYAVNQHVYIRVTENGLMAVPTDRLDSWTENKNVQPIENGITFENMDVNGWGKGALFTATLQTVAGGGQNLNVAASCIK